MGSGNTKVAATKNFNANTVSTAFFEGVVSLFVTLLPSPTLLLNCSPKQAMVEARS
jgi:hypothetical protein